jgi:hypothetical protein
VQYLIHKNPGRVHQTIRSTPTMESSLTEHALTLEKRRQMDPTQCCELGGSICWIGLTTAASCISRWARRWGGRGRPAGAQWIWRWPCRA